MEENVLIRSKHYNSKIFLIIIIAISVVSFAITYFAAELHDRDKHVAECIELYRRVQSMAERTNGNPYLDCGGWRGGTHHYSDHPNLVSYLLCRCEFGFASEYPFLLIPLGITLVLIWIYLALSKYELVVTDKRVYGKSNYGKRVDLPWDSISAIGTSGLKGIYVGTSSGNIRFKLIKNRTNIHDVMSQFLVKRQKNETESIAHINDIDALRRYKELFDLGIITQEEFDAKKKQLLGL